MSKSTLADHIRAPLPAGGSIQNRPRPAQPGNPGQPPAPHREKLVVLVSDTQLPATGQKKKTMTSKTPAQQGSKVAKKLAAKTAAKKKAVKKTIVKAATPAQRKAFNAALDAQPKSTIAVEVKDGKFKSVTDGTASKLSSKFKSVGRGRTAPVVIYDEAGTKPAKKAAVKKSPLANVAAFDSKHVELKFADAVKAGKDIGRATKPFAGKAFVIAKRDADTYIVPFSALSDSRTAVSKAIKGALTQRGFTVTGIAH